MKDSTQKTKRVAISQTDIPSVSLDEALRIPRGIFDQLGGSPSTPIEVGQVIGVQPTTGRFRNLAGAAVAYGITEGGAYADEIKVSDLGRRILKPTEEGDNLKASVEAILRPRITREFLTKYDGSPVPRQEIGRNVVEGLGCPASRSEDVLKLILESARGVGVITEINGKEFISLRVKKSNQAVVESDFNQTTTLDEDASVEAVVEKASSTEQSPNSQVILGKGIFIAHGKDKAPLAQLRKILDKFKVAYKVVSEEAHSGRAIGEKVRDTLKECNCAILIFTPDELLFDKDGNELYRPSENVIHELGAAAYLYDRRIVILKHKKIDLPSNVKEIGYIEFDDSGLEPKTMEILAELIELKLLHIST